MNLEKLENVFYVARIRGRPLKTLGPYSRFSPRVLEASFEVDRSGVLLDFDDGVEDVSSELPVDDRPGVPPLFAIGEKVTSFRTFRCSAFLELTNLFASDRIS